MDEKKKLIPKRRFKEFQNAPAWEQKQLNEISNIIGGGTPSTSISEYWNGDINWFSPSEIDDNTIFLKKSKKRLTKLGLSKSNARLLPPEKTILFTSRAGIGKMAILTEYASTNQGFQSIITSKYINPYFLFGELSSQVQRF